MSLTINIKIAWRNLWRNKRRSVLTISSIVMAVFFALLMRSIHVGTFENMINNVLKVYSGYIQIHKQGYWNDKDINNSFACGDSLLKAVGMFENIDVVVPRLESFALASNDLQSKGVLIVGVDWQREDKLTGITKRIVKGSMPKRDENGIYVARKLAAYLNLKVNDTLVLIAQGYHGVSVAEKFPVRGILKFPSPPMDNQMIYMSLQTCQEFYNAQGLVTSLSFNVVDANKLVNTVKTLKNILPAKQYEVMQWDEMLVDIVQFIKTDTVSGYIFIAILYMIISFGIFGTMIMMTNERFKEFGVEIAIGMQKIKLMVVIAIEMAFLGVLGVIFGALVSFPIITYYKYNPVHLTGSMSDIYESFGIEPLICFALQPEMILNHGLIVLFVVLISLFYPFRKILRLKVVEAMRK